MGSRVVYLTFSLRRATLERLGNPNAANILQAKRIVQTSFGKLSPLDLCNIAHYAIMAWAVASITRHTQEDRGDVILRSRKHNMAVKRINAVGAEEVV